MSGKPFLSKEYGGNGDDLTMWTWQHVFWSQRSELVSLRIELVRSFALDVAIK